MYLIDGYNLLYQTDFEHREDLVKVVDNWCRARKREALIIFDGYGQEDLSTWSVEVRFKGDADQGIIDIINSDEPVSRYVLVSDDKVLQVAAREKKMKYVKSSDFNLNVGQLAEADVGEDPNLSLSDVEVERQLEEFGGFKK